MNKILLIEKDIELQKSISYDLRLKKYEVDICDDYNDIINKIKDHNYDILILDYDNNIALIKSIRKINKDIFIFILAINDEMKIIHALQTGVNDYLIIPFNNRMLLAKTEVALRNKVYSDIGIININKNLSINTKNFIASYKNKEVVLSKLEFEILKYFYENLNMVLSRNDIMQHIWTYEFDDNNRIIDVYVHSLRRKLHLKDQLISKRGIGYILRDM